MTDQPEFSEQAQARLIKYLETHHLPEGLGNEEEACSIAAINLAISGKLTDDIPDCMSLVIGRWIIRIQDALPDDMRNSHEWKSLLPLAAGTGRQHEQERRQIIIDWLWEMVMPYFQHCADRIGMHNEWRELIEKRDYKIAVMVRDAARAKRQEFWVAAAVDVVDVAAVAACVAAVAVAVDVVDVAAARRKFFTSIGIYETLQKLIEVNDRKTEN